MSVDFLIYRFPGVSGVCCAFQRRAGNPDDWDGPCAGGNISYAVEPGRAAVGDNRRNMLARLGGLGLAGIAELNQVHGDAMRFEPEETPLTGPAGADADGMAGSRPGLGLMIKTADCQPILLADTSGRHIAALHAGWRGNRCAFPSSGVRRFCEFYGIAPQDVVAVRGPSLGPRCAEFVNFEREWGEEFRQWFDPVSRTMDLWRLTRHQLHAAGIPWRQIYGLDFCTMSNASFFSYRRDRRCGRQASLIWIAPS